MAPASIARFFQRHTKSESATVHWHRVTVGRVAIVQKVMTSAILARFLIAFTEVGPDVTMPVQKSHRSCNSKRTTASSRDGSFSPLHSAGLGRRQGGRPEGLRDTQQDRRSL